MVSAPDDPFISSLWQCAVKGAENHRLVLDDQHADHDAAAVASETPGVAGVSPGAADRGAAGRHPGRALPAGQRAAAIVVLGHRAGCGHHLTTAGPCTRLPPAGRTTFGNRLLAAPETARSPGTALVQRPVAQRPGPPPAGGGPHRYPEVTSDTVYAIEPILIPRLVVPETTGAELQAALLMNAGDHDLLDELQPLADHARGVGTPTMASKSTPGAGRRTSPASARGRRVARQHRSPAPVAGTASTPGRRRHRGDQGDAGSWSCDPNWGQPVSPPPPVSSALNADGPPPRRCVPLPEHPPGVLRGAPPARRVARQPAARGRDPRRNGRGFPTGDARRGARRERGAAWRSPAPRDAAPVRRAGRSWTQASRATGRRSL